MPCINSCSWIMLFKANVCLKRKLAGLFLHVFHVTNILSLPRLLAQPNPFSVGL